MDQYIGKMLDNRYEILERIGTGGMAVVYKARCHRLNRLVAIKILKPELASDEDFLRRFKDESQAVAMLSHINIVSIYDVCRSDDLDYIVMELIDGMTLKQYMKKRGTPLNWRESIHFITQVVRALGHAHSRGIVHRDIKPHNIMVLRDGSVKVADFGIARLISAAEATLTQEALGSVHYISPEQAKGSHVDGRSDLYSVGVMLYEMLTGRLPFEGDTPVGVAIQHINSIPISPRELNPEIPETLEAITMKAMSANLAGRYASADAMLEDLKAFRRNPGAPLPSAIHDEAIEEDPTMVVPVESIHAALENTNGDKPQEEKVEEENSEIEETVVIPVDASKKKERKEKPAKPAKKQRRDDDEDDDDYYPVRQRRSAIPTLIGFFAIILFLCGIVYFFYTFLLKDFLMPTEEYTIPDLRGYTVEELENNPSLLSGFRFEIGPTIYNEDYSEGQVCRQVPAAMSTVKDEDTVITITISGGQDKLIMPGVTGMEAREALELLQDQMKLDVKQEREYSDEYAAGIVISADLLEGTELSRGDTVTIVISRGPRDQLITVPDFENMSIERAKSQARSLGLTIGEVQEFYSEEYAEGKVMWQNLIAGAEVDVGTRIDFQVSKGAEPEETPDPEPTVSDPGPGPDPTPDVTDDPAPSDSTIDAPTPSVATKTITVDLSSLSGSVTVCIKVGNATIYNSTVDCATTTSISRTHEGSGTQQVNIYIDGILWQSYPLEFTK